VKFLVDIPLSPNLAAWLRDQGHDAVHAVELGLNRAADVDIMARAKQEGWTIITADLDYPRLLALAQAVEPSIILFREGDCSEAAVVARIDRRLTCHESGRHRGEHYCRGSDARPQTQVADRKIISLTPSSAPRPDVS
jgi:predicted nuclease of predicted toxin-antitoxin system